MGNSDSKTLKPCTYSIVQPIRKNAKEMSNQVATMEGLSGKTHSYSQLEDRVARAGTALRRVLGLARGDCCAILSLNSARYLEFYYVVPWGGQVVVPLNIRLAPPEIASVLNDCHAQALFVDDTFATLQHKLRKMVPSLKHCVYIGTKDTAPDGCVHYDSKLVGYATHEEAAPVGGDDIYGIFYTGGTTGRSKGVILSHNNIMTNAYGILVNLNFSRDSSYLHCAPMFLGADIAISFATTMLGTLHVFVPKFVPADVGKVLQDKKVTHTLMLPTMIQMMLTLEDQFDYSNLDTVLYSGSPISESMLTSALKIFNCNFIQEYGMTECSFINTLLSATDHVKGGHLLKSAGRAVLHAELAVVNEHDKEVPAGTVGELVVRGPHVMQGYFNMPEATAMAFKNGWMHTGDGAKIDENGFVYIVDRTKDMIVTGGENVYSIEVENVLLKVPGVAMCAVIGVPDEKLIEKVIAIVVTEEPAATSGITEDSIKKFCHEKIAGYKFPKHIIVRDEPLPLSGAGKILKSELRKPYWEGSEKVYSTDDTRTSNYQ